MCLGNIQNSGNGNGKASVLAIHEACSLRETGDDASLNAEIVQADCRRDDVCDGINRADFMKMNLIGGNAMSLGFRLCDDAENFFCQRTGRSRHFPAVNDGFHVVQASVDMPGAVAGVPWFA